jgi:hypothetical protein
MGKTMKTLLLTTAEAFTFTRKIIPVQMAWDCSRDGHDFSEDANYRYCKYCGYTERK